MYLNAPVEEHVHANLRPVQWFCQLSKSGQWPLQMTAKGKQLEGLGRLLKAAGVKPTGTEQIIRTHLDKIQYDAGRQHSEIVQTVRLLQEELAELRHNHSLSLAEIRTATDLMRNELEASSTGFIQSLRRAKAALATIVLIQIAILIILLATLDGDIRLPNFGSAPVAAKSPAHPGLPAAAPTQTKS